MAKTKDGNVSTLVEKVKATPTKTFFVQMLTRDIELRDAILDLIDNCIDGVVRQLTNSKKNRKQPYKNYYARLTLSQDSFQIEDNCGGIPREIAIYSAFMLGRPDPERDENHETIGMYGIGMKRAIFKMGEHCVVTSQPSKEDAFTVSITEEWMKSDTDWSLPIENTDKQNTNGTNIHIRQLRPEIAKQFDAENSTFIEDLEKDISHLFSIVINKGFDIVVNSKTVKPTNILLMAPTRIAKTESISPYIFKGTYENVSVEVIIGFYRPLASEQEIDEELTRRRTKSNAGWTIICNDRVVLSNDTTIKTGWGTTGVPAYHNQFIAIAGVVKFRSNNSNSLPFNTTKRGLNTDSTVYLVALEHMKDGLKLFTSYTNAWKKREEETADQFKSLKQVKPGEIPSRVQTFTKSRRHISLGTGEYFSPNLPKPAEQSTTSRITFSANKTDISLLGEYFFEDKNASRHEIGKRCFDDYVIDAKEYLK